MPHTTRTQSASVSESARSTDNERTEIGNGERAGGGSRLLGDLIVLLEMAKGPDRELDCLIYAEIDGRDVRYADNKLLARSRRPPHDECWLGFIDPGERARAFTAMNGFKPPIPAYTFSFDAARLLIPDGFYWLVGEGRTRDMEPLGGAQVFRPTYLVKPISEAEHESAIIALCIAALRARLSTAMTATAPAQSGDPS